MQERTVMMAEPPSQTPPIRYWQRIPIFWTALLGFSMVFETLDAIRSHPERVQGWHAFGLAALLLIFAGAYEWFCWGRIFRDNGITTRQALLAIGAQMLTLTLLELTYASSYGWLALALIYQVVGGFARRQWPLML